MQVCHPVAQPEHHGQERVSPSLEAKLKAECSWGAGASGSLFVKTLRGETFTIQARPSFEIEEIAANFQVMMRIVNMTSVLS